MTDVSSYEQQVEVGIAHLRSSDPRLAELIRQYPAYTPRPHTHYYHELISSIISQQLSVKAAATIESRFTALFGGRLPSPQQILDAELERLREVGLSRPKASYMQDLARHIADGRLELERFPELPDEVIIKELTAVKGIGEWTAHMFLMFALGRLDVLPVGDLGVRNATQLLYGFDHVPLPSEIHELAEQNGWHPYASIAAWYMWKSLGNTPA